MKNTVRWIALLAALLLVFAACGGEDVADGDPIKIGALASLSGALMDYGEQFQRGFTLGLEYATDGKMAVAGRPLQVIMEDTTTVPEVARERAIVLLDEEQVDVMVGPTSSADAFAILGLAEEYKTVLLIEPAAADFLTSAVSNRYVFRAARNTAQDSNAMAAVIANNTPGAKVAVLAPDSAFGRAYVTPFVVAMEAKGGTVMAQEFPPANTTDFTPFIERALAGNPDYLFVIWAGANNPWGQMSEQGVFDRTRVTTGAPEMAALRTMLELEGQMGFTVYYHGVAKNPVNEWLVKEHQARFGMAPDIFTSGGMATAIALVTALKKTEGNTDAEVLIQTLRGMEFDSPTGPRYFRSEDHQAQQSLFEIRFTRQDGVDHIVPELVRVISPEEVADPVQVTHER